MQTVVIPVRTPVRAPLETPIRRLHPDELCPSQKERLIRTIRRRIEAR